MVPSVLCASGVLLLSFHLPASAQDVPRPEVRGGTGATAIETVLHVTDDVRNDRMSAVHARPAGALGLGGTYCFDNSEIKLPEDPQYAVAVIGQDLLNSGRKFCPGASRLHCPMRRAG